MSNRRRPQRRDSHGAPVRTRQELWIAIATGAGVLLVTALLIVWLQNEPVGPPASSPPPSTQVKPNPSTTKPAVTTTLAPPASTTSTTKP